MLNYEALAAKLGASPARRAEYFRTLQAQRRPGINAKDLVRRAITCESSVEARVEALRVLVKHPDWRAVEALIWMLSTGNAYAANPQQFPLAIEALGGIARADPHDGEALRDSARLRAAVQRGALQSLATMLARMPDASLGELLEDLSAGKAPRRMPAATPPPTPEAKQAAQLALARLLPL